MCGATLWHGLIVALVWLKVAFSLQMRQIVNHMVERWMLQSGLLALVLLVSSKTVGRFSRCNRSFSRRNTWMSQSISVWFHPKPNCLCKIIALPLLEKSKYMYVPLYSVHLWSLVQKFSHKFDLFKECCVLGSCVNSTTCYVWCCDLQQH